jgi:diguanylate cyclase (GGDEF)-like protein
MGAVHHHSFEPVNEAPGTLTPRGFLRSMSLSAQVILVSATTVCLSVAVTSLLLFLLPPLSPRYFRLMLMISVIAPLLVAPPLIWLVAMLFVRAEARRQLAEELATIDSLTGILNRRRFFALATPLMAPTDATDPSLALLLLDIDHFKSINDREGHAAGDIVLKTVAECCSERLPSDALFARLGGEEFVVLLRNATRNEAFRVAEGIRRGIETLSVPIAGRSLSATVSIGVSRSGDGAASLDGLLEMADRAMYLAKGQGRNRVCFAGESQATPGTSPVFEPDRPHARAPERRPAVTGIRRDARAGTVPFESRTLERISEIPVRIGRVRTTLWIAAISASFSVISGLITVIARGIPLGEAWLLLTECAAVAVIVAPPVGWVMSTAALETHAAQMLAEHLSITDALTGLCNRRHFFLVAQRELASATILHTAMVILMLDIDHFKSINDTHGHGVGDTVLARVAQVARGCLRHQDILARLGGEEFVALLPATQLNAGLRIAENIRGAIEAIVVTGTAGPAIRPTLSIGIAESAAHDASISSLLERADQAMYTAKKAGRNRVCVVSDVAA